MLNIFLILILLVCEGCEAISACEKIGKECNENFNTITANGRQGKLSDGITLTMKDVTMYQDNTVGCNVCHATDCPAFFDEKVGAWKLLDIQSLAQSGKICEVLGEHWWGEGYTYRTCKLCAKKQVWKEEWQDEDE